MATHQAEAHSVRNMWSCHADTRVPMTTETTKWALHRYCHRRRCGVLLSRRGPCARFYQRGTERLSERRWPSRARYYYHHRSLADFVPRERSGRPLAVERPRCRQLVDDVRSSGETEGHIPSASTSIAPWI